MGYGSTPLAVHRPRGRYGIVTTSSDILPLAPPANLRDVRGLRTEDGRIVRRGVLYRSEVPRSGRVEGADLGVWGVPVWPPVDVIDLRTPAEHTGPHVLDAPGTTVHSIPMGAGLAPALAAVQTSDLDLTAAYLQLTRAAAKIAHIADLVASSDGPVLVHCTAGKDRTGVVVAVLLRAVGVRRTDIVADYLRTEANLPRLRDALHAAGIPSPRNRALGGVQVSALEAVLDEVDAAAGGAPGWLAAHGVDGAILRRLSARLLGAEQAPAA